MKKIDEECFKKAVARKVKELRNTSQEVLAETADISEDTVSKLEREISLISSLTLVKLCNALNVTPNDILGEFLDIYKVSVKLNEEISILSSEEKEFLLYVINFMKKNKK